MPVAVKAAMRQSSSEITLRTAEFHQQGLRYRLRPGRTSCKAATKPLRADMAATPTDDPVLKRFRMALDQAYGARIERVVLFGGREQGDARADADYEVAVFLHDLSDRWRELDRLADTGSVILEDTGQWVHAMAYAAGTYHDPTPRMHEVREGIDL
jgi:hypothetical protein